MQHSLAFLTVIGVLGAEPAWADQRARTWAIGSAVGVGAVGVVATGGGLTLGGFSLGFNLPTLELAYSLESGSSLELSMPLVNMVLVNAITLSSGAGVFSLTGYYNFNLGEGSHKFLVGPGLGFSFLTANTASAVAARLPFMIGAEFLFEPVGVRLMTRPWFEIGIGFGSGMTATAIGGGAMAEVAVMFYP